MFRTWYSDSINTVDHHMIIIILLIYWFAFLFVLTDIFVIVGSSLVFDLSIIVFVLFILLRCAYCDHQIQLRFFAYY
jgi:hypothetical protein